MIQLIKNETRKATMLQLQGDEMEAAKAALSAVHMAANLGSYIGRELARNAYYRLNLCWYAMNASDNEKTRFEAGKLKREALVIMARSGV